MDREGVRGGGRWEEVGWVLPCNLLMSATQNQRTLLGGKV